MGRWVRQLCLRRAGFVSFEFVWVWMSRQTVPSPLPTRVRAELLSAICLLPLLFCDLRCTISGKVSATDASNSGGGVCKTTGLTAEGRAFLLDAAASRDPQSACEAVLLGPFDGISAMRVAWANFGLSCHSYIQRMRVESWRANGPA